MSHYRHNFLNIVYILLFYSVNLASAWICFRFVRIIQNRVSGVSYIQMKKPRASFPIGYKENLYQVGIGFIFYIYIGVISTDHFIEMNEIWWLLFRGMYDSAKTKIPEILTEILIPI